MRGLKSFRGAALGLFGTAGALALAGAAWAQEPAPATAAAEQAAPDSDALPANATPAAPPPATPPPKAPPEARPSLVQAITGGKLLVDLRPRYEQVEQTGFARDAWAFTLRTQLGWETASWNDLKALMEFEDVRAIGGQHYNSTVNGRVQYPVIGDPPATELHLAQLGWTPSSDFDVVFGRQRVNLDDQRFIGAANWRQNEQTFDAIRSDVSYGRFSATYLYLDRINRVYGPTQDWDSDSHALNVYYTLAEPLKFEGFLYAFDFKQSPVNSSLTYGGKLSGQTWLSLFKFTYAGTYARQQTYRNNPAQFQLNYWHGELTGGFDIYSLKGDIEVLGGNGARGFGTPLATLHIYQGWADVFTTTPNSGIRDENISFDIKPRFKLPYLYNPDLFVRYNNFNAYTTSASLGHEWDLSATAQITPQLSGLVKYADYIGPLHGPASRTKVWIGFEFKL